MDGASLSNFRLLQRSLTILALFLGQGIRWAIGWLILLLAFAGPARRREWFGQCLLDLFRHLGATFIKVGQIMSTRPDLLPEHITQALAHLQDGVGPFPSPSGRARRPPTPLRSPLRDHEGLGTWASLLYRIGTSFIEFDDHDWPEWPTSS